MEWPTQIVVAVVVGIVIGGPARLLLTGRQRIGLIITIAVGALGGVGDRA